MAGSSQISLWLRKLSWCWTQRKCTQYPGVSILFMCLQFFSFGQFYCFVVDILYLEEGLRKLFMGVDRIGTGFAETVRVIRQYFNIICCLCIYVFFHRAVPGIFGNQQSQYIDVIKQMLHLCFQDQNNPQVGNFDALRSGIVLVRLSAFRPFLTSLLTM